MTVGILLITHNQIGEAMLDTIKMMLARDDLPAINLAVKRDEDPDQLATYASDLLEQLNDGDGVLVLTDAYGATPSNIANRLKQSGQVEVVTGLNLPMLIRVFNYPELALEELTQKAYSGAMDGIMRCKRGN